MSRNQEARHGKPGLGAEIKSFFSLQGVFTLRSTVVMGLMTALSVVLSFFSVNIGIGSGSTKVFSVAYLPGAVTAMLYGPWAALAYGFVSDTVKFIINPSGGYFPGYALSEMLSYFFYACFFYLRPIRIWRAVAARLFVMVTIVFGMNFIWMTIQFGTIAAKYFSTLRLINNPLQLPLHTTLIVLTLKLIERVLKSGRWKIR